MYLISDRTHDVLWGIVQAVAEMDSTCYEDNTGEMKCPFCAAYQTQDQWLIEHQEFSHDPECMVTKARVLVKEKLDHAHIAKMHKA